MKQDELITGSEFAKIKGKTHSWGTRIGQEAQRSGLPYPMKKGTYWLATLNQWEQVLIDLDWELRDRKSYRK